MKASEAIEELKIMIDSFGDQEMKFLSPEWYRPADKYYLQHSDLEEIRFYVHDAPKSCDVQPYGGYFCFE